MWKNCLTSSIIVQILSTQVSPRLIPIFWSIPFSQFSTCSISVFEWSTSKSSLNETVQFEWKLSSIVIFVTLKLTSVCIFMPWLIYTYFIYFTTDAGSPAFELPFPIWYAFYTPILLIFHKRNQLREEICAKINIFVVVFGRFPFEWKNPFGFLIAFALQYIMLSFALKIGVCVLALAIGLYVYAMAAAKCINKNLLDISRSCRLNGVGIESDRKIIWDRLVGHIEYDSSMKRWAMRRNLFLSLKLINDRLLRFSIRLVNDFSYIYKHFITILFSWSLTSICGAMLAVQVQVVKWTLSLSFFLLKYSIEH